VRGVMTRRVVGGTPFRLLPLFLAPPWRGGATRAVLGAGRVSESLSESMRLTPFRILPQGGRGEQAAIRYDPACNVNLTKKFSVCSDCGAMVGAHGEIATAGMCAPDLHAGRTVTVNHVSPRT